MSDQGPAEEHAALRRGRCTAAELPSAKLPPLERLRLVVAEDAVPAFTAALEAHADSVGFFHDEASGLWTLEAIRRPGDAIGLTTALALAAAAAGIALPPLDATPTEAGGWLEKVAENFPPQRIGRRWLVLGTHDAGLREAGRTAIVLDAGLAFGSGEHGSTRGCLRALERLRRAQGAILDLGTGSGILAIAAAKRFHRPVLATDIEPWSVLVAAANARINRVGPLIKAAQENGIGRWVRAGAPYRLVLANILARPLAAMARPLAGLLASGAHVVLAGLLDSQARQVELAWRRQGVRLCARMHEGRWTTLLLQSPVKPRRRPPTVPGIAV